MKLTKEVLKRLIKEELSNVMNQEMSLQDQLVQLQTQMDGMEENHPNYLQKEKELQDLRDRVEAGEDATAMDAGGAFDQYMGVDRYRE